MTRRVDSIIGSLFFWAVLVHNAAGVFSFNSPPLVVVNREWQVPATDPIGSVVVRADARDADGDAVTFGLEQTSPDHFGHLDAPAPFRIDNQTGVVYVNESLVDYDNKQFFLYVTVNDSFASSKTEVRVRIGPQKTGPSFLPPPPPPVPPFPAIPSFNPTVPPATRSTGKRRKSTTTTTTTTTTEIPKEITELPAVRSTSTLSNLSIQNATDQQKPPPTPSSDSLASTILPAVAIGAVLAIAATSILYIFRQRICRKAETKDQLRKDSGGMALQTSTGNWSSQRPPLNRYESAWSRDTTISQLEPGLAEKAAQEDRWEFPRHRLKVFHILGEGCFGQVWKCEAIDIDGREGPSVVAVKTLKDNAGDKEREDLQQELQVMKTLDPHPNVVRLLGCCTEKEPLFVIMEYASLGKLQSFLRNSRADRQYGNLHGRSDSLTSRELTSFMYQVARGMEYLSSKGIVHRDLAARNVLLTTDRVCKVADFGFARDLASKLVYERKSEGRLPIRWMAPESLYDNIFSAKSDVWSFGVFMWEVVTLGSTPYPGLAAAEVVKKVRDGVRLEKPEHCRREIYNIMFYCWDKSPQERPSFSETVELLEKLLVSETDYIELERFPDHSYYNMVSLSGEKI
ncbi:tyrosine kinase receptor Cad96Ca-like [Cloeon dipterum]|uniref:tyrosine kinase receptor Cad96Ca-like n=1 Tax=Cloeon dipterum TaxID=197152 RepID=UPI00321F81AA